MANTLSTHSYREAFAKSRFDYVLRRSLIVEGVCTVDRGDNKTVKNPYIATGGATGQALTGTYSVGNITITDDDLVVDKEFIEGGHVMDWENVLTQHDMFQGAIDQITYNVKEEMDQWGLNTLCDDAGAAYSTPSGGFTTKANVNAIFANINATLAGYAEAYRGMYVVVENTDLTGIIEAQADAGFSFADAALNNGLIGMHMGVEIYVTRTGTFVDATVAGDAFTNANNRVAGVKGAATFAHPRGVGYEEKGVSGKTGKELAVYGYAGLKQWATTANLTIDITLTA